MVVITTILASLLSGLPAGLETVIESSIPVRTGSAVLCADQACMEREVDGAAERYVKLGVKEAWFGEFTGLFGKSAVLKVEIFCTGEPDGGAALGKALGQPAAGRAGKITTGRVGGLEWGEVSAGPCFIRAFELEKGGAGKNAVRKALGALKTRLSGAVKDAQKDGGAGADAGTGNGKDKGR